jgi:hypothetical protein
VVRFRAPLAPVVPAGISFNFTTQGGVIRFSVLEINDVPARGRVVVRCKGRGCASRGFVRRSRRVRLHRRVGALRAGARLEIRVEARGYASKVRVFRVAQSGMRVQTRCIAPNTRKLREGCG